MSAMEPRPAIAKCDADQSILVVCDLQQRLGDAMPGKVLNRVLLNASLAGAGRRLARCTGVAHRAIPQGLGATHATVAEAIATHRPGFHQDRVLLLRL
jgi:hypothetical protein